MFYSSPPHPNIKPDSKIVLDRIRDFEETGKTGAHSPAGGILCHILNHCVRNGIDFQLSYLAGGGYSLEKKDWTKELMAESRQEPEEPEDAPT